MTYYRKTLLILLAFLLQHTTNASPADSKDIILAQEGSVTVTKHDIKMLLLDSSPSQKEKILSDKSFMTSLIDDLLVLRKKSYTAKNEMSPLSNLAKWKIKNSTDLTLSKLLTASFRNKLSLPSDLESLAKEFYDSHLDNFTTQESVHVSHILFKTEKAKCNTDEHFLLKIRKRAEQVRSDIIKGNISFEDAVKKYSEDINSNQKDGDLGFIVKGNTVENFEKTAFNLANNKLSKVFKTPYGFHIVYKHSTKKKYIRPFSEVKKNLVQSKSNEYIRSKTRIFNNSFNTNNNTKFFHKNIENTFNEF